MEKRITKKSIESRAKCAGMDITIGHANNWIGSMGKGKFAYSRYVFGRGIIEPVDGFKSLRALDEAIYCMLASGKGII